MDEFMENLDEEERQKLISAFLMMEHTKAKRYCEQCSKRLREGSDIFVHKKCWKDYEQYIDQSNDVHGIYDSVTGERRRFNENN